RAAGVAGALGLAWIPATAQGAPEPPWIAAPDHEDHHQRPPEYDDPNLAVPPASGADPEYPLAAGFVPADSSNYTANGIVSYDYVVVHTMQGYYGGSIAWFQNPAANVSAHYLMRSEDGEVTQMVRDVDRAWHVGSSNAYALGIEHEGFVAEPQWYTWETYQSSARLTRFLCEKHAIPVDRDHVVGHVELPNQTHTDPGAYWDWDLYMALVRDVVPQGRVEGVVVDRAMACTVTATVDTWVKATLEDPDALDDAERCPVDAGTSLTYLHASDDMVGHLRLHFDEGGSPCAGALGEQGFVRAADLDAPCDPQAMAAPAATVTLDGQEVPVDAEGRFAFEGVAPGAHALDVTADGYLDGMAPLEVDVYPGARVVIGLEPVPAGGDETGGSDTGPGDPDSTTGGDPPGGTAADGELTDGTGAGDDGGGPALPPGYGEDPPSGCGCTQRPGPTSVWLLPWLLFGLARRRGQAHGPA
ncbi:MAG: N-acetylmuramoyl-L-alanine amidase, partial [Myxococcales bacterium]|nr:N-acetylmuramoyl-L-alanine amidase [Myxococcales bacterium]